MDKGRPPGGCNLRGRTRALREHGLVIPVAVFVWTRRSPARMWQLALGAVSVLVYGVSNFIAIAYYSLRIT
jgi:hypothetical protein